MSDQLYPLMLNEVFVDNLGRWTVSEAGWEPPYQPSTSGAT